MSEHEVTVRMHIEADAPLAWGDIMTHVAVAVAAMRGEAGTASWRVTRSEIRRAQPEDQEDGR